MKVEVTKTVQEIEEIEIEFPFYSYEQDKNEFGLLIDIYIKNTKTSTFILKISNWGVEFTSYSRNPHNKIKSEHIKNKTHKKNWDSALKDVKLNLNAF